MLPKPEDTYSEDLYRFVWEDDGIEMVLERFREQSRGEDIACELTVASSHPTHGGTLLDGKRLLLLGANNQRDLAKALAERDETPDWRGMLEQATTLARRRYRRGEPPTDLRTALENESRYLVRPLVIDGGTTVWFGSEESAKSMLAMSVCVCVASGREVAGLVAELRGPVIYADWEDDADTHKERLQAIVRGLGLALEDVPVFHLRMTASLTESARDLRRYIAEIGAVFVVVDSIGMASGGDPQDAAGIIKAMMAARSLGVPVLGIHHLPKDAKDKSRPYGSVYAAAEARMTWLVEKDEQAPVGSVRIALTNKKSNRSARHGRVSYDLRFRSSEDREMLEQVEISPLAFMEAAAIGTGAGQKWRIASALKRPMTIEELADATTITRAVVRMQLNRHKDLFEHHGELWQMTGEGRISSESVPEINGESVGADGWVEMALDKAESLIHGDTNQSPQPNRIRGGPFRGPESTGDTREEEKEEASPW